MKLSGNRTLRWCAEHDYPVIVYSDDSWCCQWQLIVETSDETQCKIVDVSDRPDPV